VSGISWVETEDTALDRTDRFEALYVLSLTVGLRMGEALGLKWSDMDLGAGMLHVNLQLQRIREGGGLVFCEPKNASRRTIDLPQRALEALRTHRKRQAEEKLRATDYEDSGLIFATRKGTPLDAQNVINRHFKPLLKQAGLPPIRWHDLRHTCATFSPPSYWGAASTRNSYSIFSGTPR
jgi:integrase